MDPSRYQLSPSYNICNYPHLCIRSDVAILPLLLCHLGIIYTECRKGLVGELLLKKVPRHFVNNHLFHEK